MLRGIITTLSVITITIGVLLFTPFSSSAAPQCDTHENVTSVLSKKYKERRVATGVTTNGALLEIWESEGGKTWSATVSNPGGLTCLVAAGEAWRQLTQLPGTGL